MCVAWRSTPKSPTSSPAALKTEPSKSGTSNQARASRPWPGTTGTYLLSHALLALKVVVFAHCSAIHRDVNCVGFDPTGKKLVSCSDDQTVRVWDATTGEPIGSPLAGHSGR